MLQDSIKETDLMKIGRFGLGFKSVFHMTGMLDCTVYVGFVLRVSEKKHPHVGGKCNPLT